MADIIINELLCYINFNFGKCNENTLKAVILDFYEAETIAEAVDSLSVKIGELNVTEWKRAPKRRLMTDNKDKYARQLVDDLFTACHFADENSLQARLPKFCVINLENIPTRNLEDGDMGTLICKLDNIANLVGKVCEQTTACTEAVRACKPQSQAHSRTHQPHRIHQPVLHTLSQPTTSSVSAAAVSASTSKSYIDALVDGSGSSEDDAGSGGDDRDAFQDVINNKKLKRSLRQTATGQTAPRRPKPAVIKGTGTNCIIKTARELIPRKFYCISNVSQDTNKDSMLGYLKTIDINPISIFDAKTKYSGSAAFRLCIKSEDEAKLIDDKNWGQDIIIREWVFKSKQN